MSENRLVTLLQVLHKKTIERKVDWEPTARDGSFQAAFSTHVITLRSQHSQHEPDELDYVFSIVNDDGNTIESIDDVQLSNAIGDVGSGYKLMKEMHALARRIALGAEDAIDSLLKELGDA